MSERPVDHHTLRFHIPTGTAVELTVEGDVRAVLCQEALGSLSLAGLDAAASSLALESFDSRTCLERTVSLKSVDDVEVQLWSVPTRGGTGVLVLVGRHCTDDDGARLSAFIVRAASTAEGWRTYAQRTLTERAERLHGRHLVLYELKTPGAVIDLRARRAGYRHDDAPADESLNGAQLERRRFDELLEQVSDAVLEIGPDGAVTLAAGRATHLFGAPRDEMVGTSWREWVFHEDWLKLEGATATEVRVRRVDASIAHCAVSAYPLGGGHLRLIIRDLSEHKRLAQQAQAATDAAAKNERLAILGRLTVGVGHELNNPLSYLATNVHSLREEFEVVASQLPERSRADITSMLDDCDQGVKRLISIVQSLKGSSRQGEVDAKAEFDPAAAVRSAVVLFKSVHRDKVNMEWHDTVLPKVRGSAGALSQVILNLLQNGLEAMGGSGPMAVHSSVVDSGATLLVEVVDTGPGIPEAVQAKVFDAFFTTKGEGVGTGLGLYLCRQLIEGMGGALSFSTSAKGTRFFVRMPVAAVAVKAVATTAAA